MIVFQNTMNIFRSSECIQKIVIKQISIQDSAFHVMLTRGHISKTTSLCVSGFVFSASDYSQELENGLTFYFCKLSNVTTNCSCSPADYHNFTRFWFAYFKKPKVCRVPGATRTIYFITRKDVML